VSPLEQLAEEYAKARGFTPGGAARIANFARWLASRGVRVESAPPAGPWTARHALQGRWYVELEDGDYGSRPRQGPFSEAEAYAVRDALNRLGASKGTTEP